MNSEQHEMLVRIDERTEKLLAHTADHEDRLRSLERLRNWALGSVATGSTLVGIFLKMKH